ncbi:3-oxoacyl-[acyl-carrier-protein] reductase [Thermoactinomyces sp. DSM 45892]|uniref:3-oxoacyl-[acyl-carrier-protein] reductase n=1 Tax=Thermoactinomyces sp. DSM 45892 TaxID=1882753 RepID=UPI0008978D2D|nr:3-oxoacyl-[acyl-carrier-protein] reductase [Thermoactinomyces sp. DSM 45892]SDY98507.1 3-oxoacyl-[acyl-carrier-protein] reductase [Thermoactinomyces sp. DSM 45892]
MFEGTEVALVTGGSRGIGKAIAIDLAANGVTVVLTFSSNPRGAEQTIAEIQEAGGTAHAIQADISQEKEVKSLFKEVKKSFGRLDILVNNAGITKDGFVAVMSEAKWDDVIRVNLGGAFLCSREAVKIMMKQKSGAIINVSSTSGVAGSKGQTNYAASKGGIISFTKSLAMEVAEHNIRANVVAPGFIATDMTKGMDQAILSKMMDLVPLKRMGKAEEVAHLVTFLSSHKSSYITGKVFTIDGGLING